MYDYRSWDNSELKEAIEATAQSMKVSDVIIEKDFWVCFTLKHLFSLDELKDHLTFKGGTSLSKAYKLIERFSEDIDISIERKFFGFVGDKEPLNAASGKKAKKLVDELAKDCSTYVRTNFLSLLREKMRPLLKDADEWKLLIDPEDKDQQTILFQYPSLFESKNKYVKKYVKIEVGARSDHWPVSMMPIRSYVGEKFPQMEEKFQTAIRVLNPERTFWEKATILHKYAHFPDGKAVPIRQSRHYYDFYCLLMSDTKEKAINDHELLAKVVEHKSLYFKSAWANYETAKSGSLKLVPRGDVLNDMKNDYEAMNEMFFGDIPAWDKIIRQIEKFEKDFNNGSKSM